MERPAERPNEETAKLVKAVLMSEDGHRVALKSFEDSFKRCTGEAFPWQELNFSSASECLEAMRHVCAIEKLTVKLIASGRVVEDLFVTLPKGESSGCRGAKRVAAVEERSPPSGDKESGGNAAVNRPSLVPQPTVALTFGVSDNPRLNTRHAIQTLLDPYGVLDVKFVGRVVFAYFGDRESAAKAKNSVAVDIVGLRFAGDRVKSIRELFSLSFPVDSNPELRDWRAIDQLLIPHGLRDKKLYNGRWFIRFDDYESAMKVFRGVRIKGLYIAEKYNLRPHRDSASSDSTASIASNAASSLDAKPRLLTPSPTPVEEAPSATPPRGTSDAAVTALGSSSSVITSVDEDSVKAPTATPQMTSDAVVTAPILSGSVDAVSARVPSAVAQATSIAGVTTFASSGSVDCDSVEARARSRRLFSLGFSVSLNPELNNKEAVAVLLLPYGLRDVNFHNNRCYVRFDDEESAMKVLRGVKIQGLYVAERVWNVRHEAAWPSRLTRARFSDSTTLSRVSTPSPTSQDDASPLPPSEDPVVRKSPAMPSSMIPAASPKAAASVPTPSSAATPSASALVSTHPPSAPSVAKPSSTSNVGQLSEGDSAAIEGSRSVDESGTRVRRSVSLMYHLKHNRHLTSSADIHRLLDPLGLLEFHYYRDWVFLRFGSEEVARKILNAQLNIHGLREPWDMPPSRYKRPSNLEGADLISSGLGDGGETKQIQQGSPSIRTPTEMGDVRAAAVDRATAPTLDGDCRGLGSLRCVPSIQRSVTPIPRSVGDAATLVSTTKNDRNNNVPVVSPKSAIPPDSSMGKAGGGDEALKDETSRRGEHGGDQHRRKNRRPIVEVAESIASVASRDRETVENPNVAAQKIRLRRDEDRNLSLDGRAAAAEELDPYSLRSPIANVNGETGGIAREVLFDSVATEEGSFAKPPHSPMPEFDAERSRSASNLTTTSNESQDARCKNPLLDHRGSTTSVSSDSSSPVLRRAAAQPRRGNVHSPSPIRWDLAAAAAAASSSSTSLCSSSRRSTRSVRASPRAKPRIEQYLSMSEVVTEMAVHFVRILPSLKVCPFEDAEIVEMLVNAVRKSSEKVVEVVVYALLRRVDAPARGEASIVINALVRVGVKGSKDAFLERLWNLCNSNIPPLAEQMTPLYLFLPDNKVVKHTSPQFSTAAANLPLNRKRGNSKPLWKIFTTEQGGGDQNDDQRLQLIVELAGLNGSLFIQGLDVGDKEGKPTLVLFGLPPMSEACDLVLIQTYHDGDLVKLTKIWEGETERSASEAFEAFKMAFGRDQVSKGLSSMSLTSSIDDGKDSVPFSPLCQVLPDVSFFESSNSSSDFLFDEESRAFEDDRPNNDGIGNPSRGMVVGEETNDYREMSLITPVGGDEDRSNDQLLRSEVGVRSTENGDAAESHQGADLLWELLDGILPSEAFAAICSSNPPDAAMVPSDNDDAASPNETALRSSVGAAVDCQEGEVDPADADEDSITAPRDGWAVEEAMAISEDAIDRSLGPVSRPPVAVTSLPLEPYEVRDTDFAGLEESAFYPSSPSAIEGPSTRPERPSNGDAEITGERRECSILCLDNGLFEGPDDVEKDPGVTSDSTLTGSPHDAEASVPRHAAEVICDIDALAQCSEVVAERCAEPLDDFAGIQLSVASPLISPERDRFSGCTVGNLIDFGEVPESVVAPPDGTTALTTGNQISVGNEGGGEDVAKEKNKFDDSVSTSRTSSREQCAGSASRTSSSKEDCVAQEEATFELVAELRNKPLMWGDIAPNSKRNLLTYESAKCLPLPMTEVFLEEVAQQYGERDNFQGLPRIMDLAIHEIEDGRRFWGQLVEKESTGLLIKIHAILREAAKVLNISRKPPPMCGKCMARADGQWLRGYVFKTHLDEDRRPNLFDVFFVDFGFCRQLKASDVAVLPDGVQPPMLPPCPPLALPFQLDGLQGDLKNRGKERLQALILDRIVSCRILPKEADSSPMTVPKFSLNSHLFNVYVFLNDDLDETVNAIMKI